MTYITLVYKGVEKSLADWGIGAPRYSRQNTWADRFSARVVNSATAGAEIFPYDAQVQIFIGRVPAAGLACTIDGGPRSGVTAWKAGPAWSKRLFVGWRVENFRSGTPQAEGFDYKFVGPWERFMESTVFQKLYVTYNGVKQIIRYTGEVVLGLSLNTLTGETDTVPGTIATNYLSTRQQAIEIANRAITASGADYAASGAALGWLDPGNVLIATIGSTAVNVAHAQFQFDNLTTDGTGNYFLYSTGPTLANGFSAVLPDFAPLGPAQAGTPTSADYNSLTGWFLRAPLDSVRNVKCADALRQYLKWIGGMGGPATWTDHTASPPCLKVTTRDQLPNLTFALPRVNGRASPLASLKIKERDDVSFACLHLKYNVSGSIAGATFSQLWEDIAAYLPIAGMSVLVEGFSKGTGELLWIGDGVTTIDVKYGAGTQAALRAAALRSQVPVLSQDYSGTSVSQQSGVLSTFAIPTTASGWQPYFPHLKNAQSLALLTGTGLGITVTPEGGSTVSLATFAAANPALQYILDPSGGGIQTWMTDGSGNPAATVKVRFAVPMSYLDAVQAASPVATAGYHQNDQYFDATLTNIPGGTYYSKPQYTAGEPVPIGLAGYILAIQNIAQFEGTLEFQEQECTDVCPLGNNVNLTGGLPEWATMAAQIQSVEMDLDSGRTSVAIGPAKHLGAADITDLIRANRGPSTFRLFGGNLLNQPQA